MVWRPLLEAKIGDSYPGIPALWLSSRMNREKSTKLEVKGCLVHGYRSLIEAFERRLLETGTRDPNRDTGDRHRAGPGGRCAS